MPTISVMAARSRGYTACSGPALAAMTTTCAPSATWQINTTLHTLSAGWTVRTVLGKIFSLYLSGT